MRPYRKPLTGRTLNGLSRDLPAVGRNGGFTLIELTIALAVSTTLVVLILQMLDLNSRVGRVQIDLAEVQQSQRVVHNVLADAVRMAGRGGMPIGLALNALDNVDGSSFDVDGNAVADLSDVLQVRGVFENLILVDNEDRDEDGASDGYIYDPATKRGTVTIGEEVPGFTDRSQDLSYFQEMIEAELPVALLMVSARNIDTIAVVELLPGSAVGLNGDGVLTATLNFASDPSIGEHNAEYLQLNAEGDWPGDDRMTNVSMVGILDEYWYYIRESASAVDGGHPRLSRAQFFPNTTTLVGTAATGRVDIADNVMDLQIERAFDVNGDQMLNENFENQDADEWLGNDPADDFADPQWGDLAIMSHFAINTITRSQRPHLRFLADPIENFLNHAYDEPDIPTAEEEIIDRRHRRRLQRTVVELRNI